MKKRYFWLVLALALTCFTTGISAQVSYGTAFAVAPELLITNQHVVSGCSSVEIIAADGRRNGSVVVVDADIDLAVLRVSDLKGSIARLRSPRVVRLGETVMVFGYPLAGALSGSGNFASGVVSALRGFRDSAAGGLQITAPVQSGNSGGPLMDTSGLVIGVVQAKLDAIRTTVATGDIPENVHSAVSLEVLADFLTKNEVAFRDSATSAPLNAARVADLAQSFTHRVECRGKTQQTKETADVKRGRLPACAGPAVASTWTNCFGTFISDDGTYVGEFRGGVPNGQGAMTFLDGRKYVGDFRGGTFSGQGILYRADGQVLQSGTWENGEFLGGN